MNVAAPKKRPSLVAKHTIRINGRRTSVSLEPDFWNALKDIRERMGYGTITDLVSTIARNQTSFGRPQRKNLSSQLRCYVLRFYRENVPLPLEGGSTKRKESVAA